MGTENKFPGLTQTSFNQQNPLAVKDRRMTEDITPKQVRFAGDSGSEVKENKDGGNTGTVDEEKTSGAPKDADVTPTKESGPEGAP